MIVPYWYNIGWLPDLYNPYPFSWWNNGSADGVTNAINSGAFIVQHRDHGATDGWGEPNYDTTDLDNLTNTMYPFVISVDCLVGKYNYDYQVFIEKFHRMEHGCLGAIAASEVSYSFVNDVFNWGIFDCMWPQFDPWYPHHTSPDYENLRPGFAHVSGKFYLAAHNWAYCPEYKSIIYGIYHMHGDAFTTLYSEVPESLTVVHDSVLPSSQNYFTVQADDSSIIALTVNGEIIGIAEGTGGPIDIPIPPQSVGTTMKVTVTKANYFRYCEDVQVVTGIVEKYIPSSLSFINMQRLLTTGFYNIRYGFNTKTDVSITVYNSIGQVVHYRTWQNIIGCGQVALDLHHLAQGVYFIHAESNKVTKTAKVILVR